MVSGRAFDTVAALYDAQRSGYPEELFSDLSTIAALDPGARVLEIGCGSGQATAGLASRGFEITAIDPGSSLVEIARHRLGSPPNVRFAVASFEDWPLEPDCFRLVAAAQSWHWVRADIGFRKAADSLVSGGRLAIFGHTPTWSTELVRLLEPSYKSLAPEMWAPPVENWYLPDGPIPKVVTASGYFSDVVRRGYSWRRRYSASSFAVYLGTRSDHLSLPIDRRESLLASIEASLPWEIDADWVTNLYVATVRKV
jgi:SAM-dependent methyltransferase